MTRKVIPFLLLFFLTLPTAAGAQVIHDLAEIDGQVEIIGPVYNGIFGVVSVVDFNDNGQLDLFVTGWQSHLVEHVYVFLDKPLHNNQVIDLLTEKPDIDFFSESSFGLGPDMCRCDINADGVGDIAFVDRKPDYINTVHVLYGSTKWTSGTEIFFNGDTVNLAITGAYRLGYDMTSADINADGFEDLIIGAYDALNPIGWSTGAAYVFFAGPHYTSPMTIDLAVDQADITIYGAKGNDNLGQAVSAGDVNGDGIMDLIVGAYSALNFDDHLGRVYLFLGRTDWAPNRVINLANEDADITIIGPEWGSLLGGSVASADVNGDGIDDILAGAISVDGPPQSRGNCYAFWGGADFTPGTILDLRTEQADLTCLGEDYGNLLGSSMSAGDLDGDGIAEWVLCSRHTSGSSHLDGTGQVYVIAGPDAFPPNHVIDFSIDQPTIKILGHRELDSLSARVNSLEDLNGDGICDLQLTSPGADLPDRETCGRIHIFFGHSPLNDPPRLFAGPGPHAVNRPEVRLYDPFDSDQWLYRLRPYLVQGFGAVTAMADLDGDGYDWLVTGPGPGPAHPAAVMVFTGGGELECSFLAYGTPRYGVNIAGGDIDGDGMDEIVTGAGPGAVFGPHVRGWQYSGGAVVPMPDVSYMAYGTLRWGVNVACGDLDGDGREEIVTGAGPGKVFGPHVRAWRLDQGMVQSLNDVSFLAYGVNAYGVKVACGDIDGDGMDEIVTGPGPAIQFGSHVRGWNYDGQSLTAMDGVDFFAFTEPNRNGGVAVACGDIDNDRIDEILTAPGPLQGNPPWMKSWNYDGAAVALIESKSFMVFEQGEFIGGANLALGNFYEPPDYLP